MTIANETTVGTSADETMTPVVVEADQGIPALNKVELKIATFRDLLVKDNGNLTLFQVQGWDILWKQIAAAYEIGRAILDAANKADFEAALANCGIKVGKMTNRWVLVTKLLYGEWTEVSTQKLVPWDSSVNSVFELDRSAEKYSTYFRHFEEKKLNPADVYSYIKGFDHATHGRHLKGIEKMFRSQNAKATGISDEDAKALGSRTDVKDVISFDRPKELTADLGTAFFRVIGDKVFLLGVTELKDDAFDKKAVVRGKKLFAENRKEVEAKAALEAVEALLTKAA